MGLLIPRACLQQVHDHAREGYPFEVVGVLAGDRATVTVRAVASLRNERADSPANRYQVGALALARAEAALADAGHEVIGYYHSHPDHPARYSEFDRDHAWPNMSYVIVSVEGGTIADTLCWRLREDRGGMDPEAVTLLED